MEIWKPIKDCPNYEISNLGNVKSLKFGKEKHLKISIYRYKSVMLSVNGFYKPYLIHRLIAINFIDNPENKPQVNHIDGNKLNNLIDNLEWCSNSENQKHAYKTGLQKTKKGELSHRFGIPNCRAKKIIFLPSGKKYDNILLASKDLGISVSKLYKQVSGINKNKLGIHYI